MPFKDIERARAYSRNWAHDHPKEASDRVKRRQQRRLNFLNKYKLSKGCADCGYNKAAVALDFHHVDINQKSFGLSRSAAVSFKKMIEEMEKCIIVCANCHRIRTHQGERNGQ